MRFLRFLDFSDFHAPPHAPHLGPNILDILKIPKNSENLVVIENVVSKSGRIDQKSVEFHISDDRIVFRATFHP